MSIELVPTAGMPATAVSMPENEETRLVAIHQPTGYRLILPIRRSCVGRWLPVATIALTMIGLAVASVLTSNETLRGISVGTMTLMSYGLGARIRIACAEQAAYSQLR